MKLPAGVTYPKVISWFLIGFGAGYLTFFVAILVAYS